MRLTAIKLAGFKSFVDPITLKFGSNLTGVVGPNGCGKSNIIDAVRWVMGEISARQLRGESMSDVIFNGSSARKPVGTASVELLFDNSQGRAGGEYAAYNEIAVRRQVSRDGASSYFLNGTRCRRKDITDLFLGTGLGPRSYSIIEQGMISQVVEARPEELRQYLEEAAGISKYRERRRETENRIRHTRENLDRLNDLREEVSKHLDKLKRQARAAERYKKLQAEKRDLDARLLALQWRELQTASQAEQERSKELEVKLEQAVSAQRHAEAGMEMLREQQTKAQDHLGGVQGELYQLGARIAQTEQSIQHQRELRDRQEREHNEINANLKELSQLRSTDLERIDSLRKELAEREPEQEKLQQALEQRQQEIQQQEQQIGECQSALRRQLDSGSQHSQQTEVLRTRIQHLDEQMAKDVQRLTRLREEQQQLDPDAHGQELQKLAEQAEQAGQTAKALQHDIDQQREQLQASRDRVNELQQQLQDTERRISTDQGRLQSLHALQQAALGQDDESARQWLREAGLDQQPRLASSLDVPDQWATAVETVLGDYLQAVLVDDAGGHAVSLAGHFSPDDEGGLVLVSERDGKHARSANGSPTLADQVQAPAAIRQLLASVLCADSLESALALQQQLASGQSVITPSGEWLGSGWVRIHRGDNPAAGSLRRQQEIRELDQRLEGSQQQAEQLQQQLEQAREQRVELEDKLEQTRLRHNQAHHELSRAEAARASLENRLQAMTERRRQLQEEFTSLTSSVSQHETGASDARGQLEEYIDALSGMHQEQERLETELKQHNERHAALREQLKQQQNDVQQAAIGIESRRASLESLQESCTRADQQYQQLEQRRQELTALLEQQSEPGAAERETLDELLKQQLSTEERLKDARVRLDEIATQLRDTDGERQQAVSNADDVRSRSEQVRMHLQELKLRADNIDNRLQDLDGAPPMAELAKDLPEDVVVEEWQAESEKLEQRIRRLEPVNLAAISEFEQEAERKSYLDKQDADLQEALATLEKAIARIDRTTRTRFKETFEQIRAGMETLFPRLFGGGHAYLELTSDDLLTTGVSIMARPPGKRVSSIHLLSGGEKALTAVAFVFAIFGLNPAPFCMLDEVDAPLDDANVGRFSKLVREMSEQVQFIMVTHNKVTMEMADQLVGVTMREAGVSRMVSVDIEQAAQLADS